MDHVGPLGTLTYQTVNLFKTNTPWGGSPEDMIKVYALGGGSPYNKVKVYSTMNDLPRYDV